MPFLFLSTSLETRRLPRGNLRYVETLGATIIIILVYLMNFYFHISTIPILSLFVLITTNPVEKVPFQSCFITISEDSTADPSAQFHMLSIEWNL